MPAAGFPQPTRREVAAIEAARARRGDEDRAIQKYLDKRGVTRCPTVAVLETTATIDPRHREALMLTERSKEEIGGTWSARERFGRRPIPVDLIPAEGEPAPKRHVPSPPAALPMPLPRPREAFQTSVRLAAPKLAPARAKRPAPAPRVAQPQSAPTLRPPAPEPAHDELNCYLAEQPPAPAPDPAFKPFVANLMRLSLFCRLAAGDTDWTPFLQQRERPDPRRPVKWWK